MSKYGRKTGPYRGFQQQDVVFDKIFSQKLLQLPFHRTFDKFAFNYKIEEGLPTGKPCYIMHFHIASASVK